MELGEYQHSQRMAEAEPHRVKQRRKRDIIDKRAGWNPNKDNFDSRLDQKPWKCPEGLGEFLVVTECSLPGMLDDS